ncbi:MAG: type-F conjugative transfer system pilin assembly protein TrbC [Proteobacteria bacterium]|nr:type-F conjugative transfer system pilin assembly protein TrbC [Pseudomonadota bacterium]
MLASNDSSQNSAIQKLQEESLQKINTLLKDKEFQDVVSSLETKASCSATNLPFGEITKDAGSLSKGCQTENCLEKLANLTSEDSVKLKNFYIFVSCSLGEKALLNVAQDAKKWGATLVLRGFKEGSYLKTAKALQKVVQEVGQGFIIDPELFTLFAIQTVPTFVLSKPFHLSASERMQTPIHDRIQGHVSPKYALETFAKEGDLKDEAKSLLLAGEAK